MDLGLAYCHVANNAQVLAATKFSIDRRHPENIPKRRFALFVSRE